MARRTIRTLAAALLPVALVACDAGQARNGRATIRLSPESVSFSGADGALLVDRDTTVPVPIAAAATLTLRFPHDVEIRRVKVHGARSLRVAAEGLAVEAAGDARWAAGDLASPATRRELVVALEPTGPDAQVDEIEVWGAGKDLETRGAAAVAESTRAEDAPARENLRVLRASPAAATLRPGPSDVACLRARFPAGDPRQARRAYLALEADVPRAIALQHTLGASAPASGFWLGRAEGLRTLVHEVDPERLQGGDELLLCLPDDADAEVNVQGVRLLLALDDGREAFDRETARRFGAALDGDRETEAPFHGGAQVLELERPREVEEAELRLAHVPARLEGLARMDGAAWVEAGALDLAEPVMPLPVAGRAVALRVTFQGPARSDVAAASVAELELKGSGVGPRTGRARIVLTYPATAQRGDREVGERFGPRAHVAGWAESPAGRGAVEIDGARVDVDGAFSQTLLRPLGTEGGWPVTLRARFPDGTEISRTIHLDDDREGELLGRAGAAAGSDDLRFGREDQTSYGAFDPAAGGKVGLGTDVYVEAPPGAVGARTSIGISRKGHEAMPHLDPGMINVTAPAHAAYRFLPKGQRFAKAVKVVLPYDPELLPEGVLPEEVQTYYFDEAKDRWLTLPRREVLRGTRQVVSETTHFTFMINAVLVLPDHPGPVSFNPNSIKDLKAADPSAGIDLVEAPQGNTEGTARLAFPIRLPRARGAFQPSLAISYDSATGNGWLGVGWDVAVPRVQIDTRYGVPEYTGEERYLLDGQALVPVPSTEPPTCADGETKGRLYRARVERDFRRILRCGEDPTRYWFEVSDKGGTLFVYGHGPNARLTSYIPRVVGVPTLEPAYDIAEWYLERVVDANGNLTAYAYQHDSPDAGDGVHKETFRQAYLRSIQYSGTTSRRGTGALVGGTVGPYLVELHHGPPPRDDEGTSEVTSARNGFKTVQRRRLGAIEVRLLSGTPSGLVRRYALSYRKGDMGKWLLDAVAVEGADGKAFYSHSFEYEQKAPHQDDVTLFGRPTPWIGAGRDWGLGASQDSSFGFHGFVGLGVTRKKQTATVGLGFGFGRRKGETLVSTVDVNGDGLPDRVYGSGAVLFNSGAGQAMTTVPPAWDPGAGIWDPDRLPDPAGIAARTLGKDEGNTFDVSLQAFYGSGKLGGSLNVGASYATSSSKDFVLDANGDGLPDLVNGGKVYFNQPRRTDCGSAPREECCPAGELCFLPSMSVPALEDLGDSAALLDADPAMAAANRDMEAALTPQDAVLEWTAPWAGAVDVSGMLAFANPTASGERRDGVRLRVYRYDPSVPDPEAEERGTYVKPPGEAAPTSVQLGNVPVDAGTILYFVLSTLSDFPMNDAEGQISPAELVSFAPVITYRGIPAAERAAKGPAGAQLYRFDAAQDFVLAGEPQGAVSVPRTGRIALDLRMSKRATSDAVRVCVQYQDPPPEDGSPAPRPGPCAAGDAFFREFAPSERVEPEQVLAVPELEVKAGGALFFRVDTHVAIDPRAVSLKVAGTYACANDDAGACVPPNLDDADERRALSFRAAPYVRLHDELVSLSPAAEAWTPSGQALRPFRVTKRGRIVVSSRAAYASREMPIYFTVRTLDRLVFKRQGDHGGFVMDAPEYVSESARVEPGELVFFEAHSESARSFDAVWYDYDVWSAPVWDLTCSFVPDEGRQESCSGFAQFTSDGHANEWDGNRPVLAGGFHGWRYGAWNGKDGEPFAPWVYRGPTRADAAGWESEGDDVVDARSEEMQREDDPQRVRLRLAGLLVPNATGTVFMEGGDGFEQEGDAFVSQDGNTYFARGRMHAGRKGESASVREKGAASADVQPLDFRIGKIGRSSTAISLSGSASLGIPFFSAGASLSSGLSQSKLDVLDMNGDGILDVVVGAGMPDPLSSTRGIVDAHTSSHVRITDPVRLSTRRTVPMNGFPQLSRDVSGSVNLGASPPMPEVTPKGNTRAVVARFTGFGGGLAFSVGSVLEQLVDVNGDGLPDSVRVSTSACESGIGVHLNMGTSFAAAEDCVDVDPGAFPVDSVLSKVGVTGTPALRRSNTVTLQGTSGADLVALGGGTDRSESYGASVSAETSLTATNVALVDVTGDGLPDYVYKGNSGDAFAVRVNTGYGFADEVTWRAEAPWCAGSPCPGAPRLHLGIPSKAASLLGAFTGADSITGIVPLEATGSHSVKPSFAFAFNFSFPIFITPWIHVGAGASWSPRKVSGFELGLQDIDGDGLADQVLKTQDDAPIWARLNQLGRANLLTKVVRPLRGTIDLAYEQRVGNTVDMPQSRWVLTKVTAGDGRGTGTGHELETTWEYEAGRYDRIEREFLGFAKVTRRNPDDTWVEQRFDNASVLTKGLLLAETLGFGEGEAKRPLVETVNAWHRAPDAPEGVLSPIPLTTADDGCWRTTPVLLDKLSYCGSFFTKLDGVEKRFYEDEPRPGIVTRQEFEYDDRTGDVVTFRDLGDVADSLDDLAATIQYATDAAATELHSVSRPKLVEIRDRDGKLLRSRSAEYYASEGNLHLFDTPIGDGRIARTELQWNSNGTLEWVKGPENEAKHRYQTNYGYDGVTGSYVTSITDSHGYTSSAEHDLRFGEPTRTTDVNGKVTARRLDAFGRVTAIAGPQHTLETPTVSISYAPEARVPYAWTRNRMPRRSGDTTTTVDTVVAMDGLGRVVQTKKTAEIATSEMTKGVGWSVSGHQVFDDMGRVAQQGQPFASFSSRPEYVPGTPKNATQLTYDLLGRVVRTVEPNGAVTRVDYGFGKAAGALMRRFRTATTDAEGKTRASYRDGADRVVAVEEWIEGRTPTTHYEYSPVGDLTRIVDAAGNATRLEYDLLGRRLVLDNPDTGKIRFELDPAGNVIRRYDANLSASQGPTPFVKYVYDYDQLVRIDYPDATRPVVYTYGSGAEDAERNGIGRVVQVEDDAGTELRSYGALGELTSTTRVLLPMFPGDRGGTFTTSFEHDSFGRMMSINYPDGEKVEYGYDRGGLLESATGRRAAGTAVPGDEVYLASMAYDEFGQRVRMVLGNGVTSTYAYDPLTRRLAKLETGTPLGRTLQNITYAYDRVGNVTTMVNGLGAPVGDRSGTVTFRYGYDDLHRLRFASGEARSRAHTLDRFTASYGYSDIHNMLSNVQVHEIVHGADALNASRPPKTNHVLGYDYDPAAPHRATKIGDTFLVYDENGNTIRECRDAAGDPACGPGSDHVRSYAWTAENRLAHVIDGGGRNMTKFVYDAAGDRVVKLGRGGEAITVGQFWSLKGRRAATKHVFAGATRLASKLLPPPGWSEPGATQVVTAAVTVSGVSGTTTSTVVGDGLPNENGCDPSSYQPQKCPVLPGGEPSINHQYDDTRVRPETYYYHPDHLGSTSWVTDQHARVHEHVEYFPYGAVWRDPRSDADGGPVKGQRFLFTGKEMDEETGLYYFGARYYDPVRARWLGTDPALLTDLARNPARLSAFAYVRWSPARLIDPDGRDDEEAEETLSDRFGRWYDSARASTKALYKAGTARVTGILPTHFNYHPPELDADNAVTKSAMDENVAEGGTKATEFVLREAALGKGTGMVFGGMVRGWRFAGSTARFLGRMEAHHALPKFLGGATRQVLVKLPVSVHRQFHSILRKNLRNAGIPLNVGGTGGSAADWAWYMRENPNAQRAALDAVLDASRTIDARYGTSITQDVWRNIIEGNFRTIP